MVVSINQQMHPVLQLINRHLKKSEEIKKKVAMERNGWTEKKQIGSHVTTSNKQTETYFLILSKIQYN